MSTTLRTPRWDTSAAVGVVVALSGLLQERRERLALAAECGG